jgi:DNA modification methylase
MKRDVYIGDNLDILRRYIPSESVDLLYLDPPFKSDRRYNRVFQKAGARAAAQERAFEDTWEWNATAEHACQVMMRTPGKLGEAIAALYRLLGEVPMMAYIAMMAPRLVELRRVLKTTGSIWLHCDPTASHYLKVLMDAVFGAEHFRNEIIWQRSTAKGHAFTRFPSAHDVLLYYSKGSKPVWNTPHLPHRQEYLDSHYDHVEPKTGRRYTLGDCLNPNPDRPNLTYEWKGHRRVWRWTKDRMEQLHDEGRLVYTRSGLPRYKRYLDEMPGTPVTSVWADIPPINSQAQERVGFPTQKPNALLKRIIEASSKASDVVLDPFCGCATALVVAEQLGRQWIGIDITDVALDVMQIRLKDVPYVLRAREPRALPEAIALARSDRKHFETWALGLVGARPEEPHRGADRGIDARFLDLHDRPVVVSVKSGKVTVAYVRDLRGVLERERAIVGALLTLYQPTRAMIREAATAGSYESPIGLIPRLQILTIARLLDPNSRRIVYPPADAVLTRPPRERRQESAQFRLPLVTPGAGGQPAPLPRQEVATAAPPLYASRRRPLARAGDATRERGRARRRRIG